MGSEVVVGGGGRGKSEVSSSAWTKGASKGRKLKSIAKKKSALPPTFYTGSTLKHGCQICTKHTIHTMCLCVCVCVCLGG